MRSPDSTRDEKRQKTPQRGHTKLGFKVGRRFSLSFLGSSSTCLTTPLELPAYNSLSSRQPVFPEDATKPWCTSSFPSSCEPLGPFHSSLLPFLYVSSQYLEMLCTCHPQWPHKAGNGNGVGGSHYSPCPTLTFLHDHPQPCGRLLPGAISFTSISFTGDPSTWYRPTGFPARSSLPLQIILCLTSPP